MRRSPHNISTVSSMLWDAMLEGLNEMEEGGVKGGVEDSECSCGVFSSRKLFNEFIMACVNDGFNNSGTTRCDFFKHSSLSSASLRAVHLFRHGVRAKVYESPTDLRDLPKPVAHIALRCLLDDFYNTLPHDDVFILLNNNDVSSEAHKNGTKNGRLTDTSYNGDCYNNVDDSPLSAKELYAWCEGMLPIKVEIIDDRNYKPTAQQESQSESQGGRNISSTRAELVCRLRKEDIHAWALDRERVLKRVCKSVGASGSTMRRWEDAARALREIEKRGYRPDVVFYSQAMRACGHEWEHASELFSTMIHSSITPNAYAYTSFLGSLSKAHQWQLALEVLRHMEIQAAASAPTPSPQTAKYTGQKSKVSTEFFFSTTSMDMAYSSTIAAHPPEEWRRALALLHDMVGLNRINSNLQHPSDRASEYCPQNDDCSSQAAQRESEGPSSRTSTYPMTTTAVGACLSVCGAAGQVEAAESLLHMLVSSPSSKQKLDVRAFTSALRACQKDGKWEAALRMLHLMRSCRVQVDQTVLSTALGAFRGSSSSDNHDNHDVVMRGGSSSSLTSLKRSTKNIGSSGRTNDDVNDDRWAHALRLLADARGSLIQPNIISYSTGIKAMGERWDMALQLLQRMECEQVAPNEISFTSAIQSCEKTHQWVHAVNLLHRMHQNDLRVTTSTIHAVLCTFPTNMSSTSSRASSCVAHDKEENERAKSSSSQAALRVFQSIPQGKPTGRDYEIVFPLLCFSDAWGLLATHTPQSVKERTAAAASIIDGGKDGTHTQTHQHYHSSVTPSLTARLLPELMQKASTWEQAMQVLKLSRGAHVAAFLEREGTADLYTCGIEICDREGRQDIGLLLYREALGRHVWHHIDRSPSKNDEDVITSVKVIKVNLRGVHSHALAQAALVEALGAPSYAHARGESFQLHLTYEKKREEVQTHMREGEDARMGVGMGWKDNDLELCIHQLGYHVECSVEDETTKVVSLIASSTKKT